MPYFISPSHAKRSFAAVVTTNAMFWVLTAGVTVVPAPGLHDHMLDDGPPHYWSQWYTNGDGPALARGVEAALAHMNSARKATSGQ